MANREFTDLLIKDMLPEEAIYVKLVSVKNLTSGGEVTDYSIESEPSPGQYGGNLTIRIPRVRGNSGDTIEVTLSMYFPFQDKQGEELISFSKPESVRNEVNVSAYYQGNPTWVTDDLSVSASSMTYSKSVSLNRDNYPPGISREDLLEYRVSFWLSDYYNVSIVEFDDTLGDGQAVLRNMTPTFYVVNGSHECSGSFPPDSYEFGSDHSGPDGSTPLYFNLTKALEEVCG